MRTAIEVLIAIAITVSIVGGQGDAQSTQPDRPLTLQEIGTRGIEGHLGEPIGTIVTVDGEVIPNDSRAKIDSAEPFFLRIDSVDGRALAKPVQYRFTESTFLRSTPKPKVGEKFRYVGYETGEFVGSPKGEAAFLGEFATTDFHFRPRFEIIANKNR